ncbi:hypothetical protein [Deinococcus rufus]|uniref:Secreted protein n=1 Tax=Deinococcus rufus TaxID=2136097 RepID=A0ABV7Z9S9_9DEIO
MTVPLPVLIALVLLMVFLVWVLNRSWVQRFHAQERAWNETLWRERRAVTGLAHAGDARAVQRTAADPGTDPVLLPAQLGPWDVPEPEPTRLAMQWDDSGTAFSTSSTPEPTPPADAAPSDPTR